MDQKISRIAERLAYSDPGNPWVTLYFDLVAYPDGTTGRYNRIVEGRGHAGVAILPVSADPSIGLLRHYRYPVATELIEVPRGFGESADTEAEAFRELTEETFLPPESFRLLPLGSIHPNSGLLASEVALYAAILSVPHERLPAARSRLVWYSLATVLQLIASGGITDAFTICAVFRAQLLGVMPSPPPTSQLTTH